MFVAVGYFISTKTLDINAGVMMIILLALVTIILFVLRSSVMKTLRPKKRKRML